MIEIDAGMPQTALRKMQIFLPRCTAAMTPAQTRHQPSKIACRMRNIMFLPRKTELRDLPALKYASLLCRRGEIQKRACKDAPGVWGWGSLQPRAVGTRACWYLRQLRGSMRLLAAIDEGCCAIFLLTALQLSQQATRSPWKRLDVTLAHQQACLLSQLCHFCCRSAIHFGLHHWKGVQVALVLRLSNGTFAAIPHQPRFFFFQLTDFISRRIFFMRTFWNEKLLQWKTVIFNRYCTFIFPLENRKKTSFWPYWRLRVYSSIINFAQNLYCIRRVREHWCSITNVDNRHTKLS